MTLTLLVDLDDTLLANSIDSFLPAYLSAFSSHVSPVMDPGLFTRSLLFATNQMAANRSPQITLRQAFETAFYPQVKIAPDKFEPLAEQFYTHIFPGLQKYTRPIPEAVKVILAAQERGYQIVIATNPLFPARAIHHRLSWAGLSPDSNKYQLITSYEDFHFAKPELAYYAEVMARLGWPGGPVLMVGNDLEADIRPAQRLGLPVYWIPSPDGEPEASLASPTLPAGQMAGLLSWIDQAAPAALTARYSNPEAWLAILLATPAALASMCRRLPSTAWQERPAPDEWCVTEMLCHWRDVESEVNLPRLQQILQSDDPFLPGKDTDPWAAERRYIQQDGSQALADFIQARQQLLARLVPLAPEAWNRPARHAILGHTHLGELVEIISSHDRLHLQQLHHSLQRLAN